MKKFIRHLRLPIMLFLAVFATVLCAEDEDFSPWEAWRQGFSYYDKGEKAKEKGETEQALELFSKSRKCYLDVKKARPEWNQKIIGSRISMCEKEIDELKNKISAKKITDKGDSESTPSSTQTSYSSSEDSSSNSLELEKYKKKLFAALIELDELRRQVQRSQTNTTEIENLMREKRVLQEKINLLEQKCTSLQEKSLQPDSEKSEMKNRLIEEKMKVDITNQKLQMEQNQTEKLRQELAELYKAQTVLKYSQQEALQRQRLQEKDLQTLQKQKSDYSNERESFLSKINQLTIENTQAQAGLKDKQSQLEKLKKWTDDLQQKGGDQSKLNNEVMAENEKVRAKYEVLKTENEKNLRDIQILKDSSRETNINMTQLKDTLKSINDQKNQLVDEYKNLQNQYNQRTISESVNSKELQNIRMRNMKLEQDLKLFAEKYETIQKRIENRASSEYQNILAINQQQKELTDKLTAKTIEFEKLNTQHAMLSDKLQTREKVIKELSADMQELKTENRNLKLASQSLTEQNSKLPQLQNECVTLKKTIDELKKEQADLAGVNEKYQKALEELKNFKEMQTGNLALQKLNQELSDDNRKLKLALDDFQKTKNELSSAQNALKELTELKSANQALMQKCTVYADKYSVLSDSSKKLTEKLLTVKEENMELSEKYLQLNNHQEKQAQQNLKLSDKIKAITQESIKLQAQNTSINEQQEKQAQQNLQLNEKIKAITQDNIKLQAQNTSSNEQQEKQAQQNLQINEKIKAITQDNIKLQAQNISISDQCEKLTAEKETELQQLKLRVNQLALTNKNLTDEKIKFLAGADEIIKIKQLMDRQREDLKEKSTELKQHADDRKKLADELNQKNKSISSLQDGLEQQRQENAQLSGKITTLQPLEKNILTLKAQNKILEQKLEKLQTVSEDYQKLSQKYAEQENFKNEFKRLQANVKNLEEQNKILSGKNIGNEQIASQFEKVNAIKRQIELKLSQTETENLSLKNELFNLKKQLATLHEKFSAQNNDRANNNAVISKYSTVLAAKEKEINVMALSLKKQTENLDSALKNEVSYKDKIAALTQTNTVINQKLELLLKQQKDAAEQFKTYQQKLAASTKAAEEYKNRLSANNEKNTGDQKQIAEYRKLAEINQQQAEEYKKQVKEIRGQTEEYKKQAGALRGQTEEIEKQRVELKRQVAENQKIVAENQKIVAEYQLKLSSSQNKNKEYEEKLLQYNQQTTDNKQQLDTFNTQKQKYMTMLRNLEIQLNSRENTVKELTLQKDRLNQQTNDLAATTKKLREQIQELSQKTTAKVVFKENKLPENRISEELKNGINAEKSGSTEVAIWHYRKILETNPEHVETNRRLGLTLLNREQYSEAVNYLQKAYIMKESSVENAIAYSQALAGLKKYGNAYSILQKALKNNPDNHELLTEYGVAMAGIGKIDGAKNAFSAALKISPDALRPNLMMATIIAQNEPKQLDDAVKYYRKARKLGAVPDAFLEKTLAKKLADNAEMLEFLSQAAKEAEKNKDWTSAAWYYNQLAEIEPDNQDYTNRTGMIYILQKNQEKALKTLSLKNNNITGALLAGAAAAISEKPDTALKYYQQAHDWNSSQRYQVPQYLLQTIAATEQAFKKLAKNDKSGDAAKAYAIFQELVKK